jgi:CheY-like chemotaxis protein
MIEGRPRILAVEDDSEAADQLVEFLSTSGYQIDLAADGSEGLSRGRSADYAVMTIDRMLPDMDGIAIIRRLREDGIGTPALIISALGEIDDRVRGLRAGGDDYLAFVLPAKAVPTEIPSGGSECGRDLWRRFRITGPFSFGERMHGTIRSARIVRTIEQGMAIRSMRDNGRLGGGEPSGLDVRRRNPRQESQPISFYIAIGFYLRDRGGDRLIPAGDR